MQPGNTVWVVIHGQTQGCWGVFSTKAKAFGAVESFYAGFVADVDYGAGRIDIAFAAGPAFSFWVIERVVDKAPEPAPPCRS